MDKLEKILIHGTNFVNELNNSTFDRLLLLRIKFATVEYSIPYLHAMNYLFSFNCMCCIQSITKWENEDLLGHAPWFPGDSSFRRQQ